MSQLRVKLFLIICMLSNASFALPSDQQQVLHVVADSADLSQQNHRGTYTGNVAFQQGTTNIQADNAITEGSTTNQLVLAIANGNKNQPAHYWTEAEAGKPPFHAYADSIRYYPLRHLVELKGHARVQQGKNSLSADVITYDTLKQQVRTKNQGKNKTSIIFYPEKKTL